MASGTRIIEYMGQRITHEEASRRHEDTPGDAIHVVLFAVDDRTVIDGAVRGNEARFINHSCEPSCQAVEDAGRIFIEALRDILPGEELTYDYALDLEGRHTRAVKARYPCHCGTPRCRGTLLAPRSQARKR
jgi:hypothetical protein